MENLEHSANVLFQTAQKDGRQTDSYTFQIDKDEAFREIKSTYARKHWTIIVGDFIIRATRIEWKKIAPFIESEGVIWCVDIQKKSEHTMESIFGMENIFEASKNISKITRRFNNVPIPSVDDCDMRPSEWKILKGTLPEIFQQKAN